jgi:hypothetical protein
MVAMDEDSSADDEWPPPAARLRAIRWRAEGHLDRREFVAASRALREGFGLGEDDLLRGLYHLAAAGYKAQTGDTVRARRQLEHARRRLALHPETAGLVSSVEDVLESPHGAGELA